MCKHMYIGVLLPCHAILFPESELLFQDLVFMYLQWSSNENS